MKDLFETYKSLWPEDRHESLAKHLTGLLCVSLADYDKVDRTRRAQTLVCDKNITLAQAAAIFDMNFDHVLQEDRSDFANELLATALMVKNQAAVFKNPLPFIFAGETGGNTPTQEHVFRKELSKSSERSVVLDELFAFISGSPKMQSLAEICLQSADELMTNAFYNAPIQLNGSRPLQNTDRTVEVLLEEKRRIRFFAQYTSKRLVIGCEDTYGSFERDIMVENYNRVLLKDKLKPRQRTAGAGIGFRFLVDNAAGTYVFVEKKKRTLICSAFLPGGLELNLSVAKHLHANFI